MTTIDKDALRALQAPLKDRYREQPEAALVTLTASGTLDDELACNVQTGRALAKAGLHPATGGDGSLLCSGDMLLEALVACAGVTLKAVATAIDVEVRPPRSARRATSTSAARSASIAPRPSASPTSACASSSTRPAPRTSSSRRCSSSPSATAWSCRRCAPHRR